MSRRLVVLLLVLLVAWGGLAAIIYAGLTPIWASTSRAAPRWC